MSGVLGNSEDRHKIIRDVHITYFVHYIWENRKIVILWFEKAIRGTSFPLLKKIGSLERCDMDDLASQITGNSTDFSTGCSV